MRKRTDWRQVALTAGLALSALWLGSLVWNLASKAELAWSQARDTKNQYEELEARKAVLTADIAALETPLGQDAAVRAAFDVARPGEEVIVLVPPATTTATTTPSWWQSVLNWF